MPFAFSFRLLLRRCGIDTSTFFEHPAATATGVCGVGVPVTQPSLGTLIRIGNNYLFSGQWWMTVFPSITLSVLVLAVNILGDWLRDALNPLLR